MAEGAGAFRPLDQAAQWAAAFRPGLHCLVAGLALQVEGHGIQRGASGRTEGVGLRRRSKSSANGVLFNVPYTVHELLFAHDLALVEAAHPHLGLALQAERETSFDELHRLFKRHVGGGRDQSVEMVRHDDECVQKGTFPGCDSRGWFAVAVPQWP